MDPKLILKDLKSALCKELDISNVILFGSYARNQNHANSDFDTLVILKEKLTQEKRDKIRDICYDISLDNNIIIDSKIVTEDDLKNTFWGKHPLYTEALNHGIYA